MAKSTGRTATYQVLSASVPHPTRPNWCQFDALLNDEPVVVEYRVPSPNDEPPPQPIQFSENDLRADPSTTWGRIVAHLTTPASVDRKAIPILGGIG